MVPRRYSYLKLLVSFDFREFCGAPAVPGTRDYLKPFGFMAFKPLSPVMWDQPCTFSRAFYGPFNTFRHDGKTFFQINYLKQGPTCFQESFRAISTARLRTLPPLHLQPINVVVSYGPLARSHLEVSFALRCFQRLSHPDIATLQCSWRHNRYTRGLSNTVLSYWYQVLSNLIRPQQIGTELSHDVLNPARVPL